MKIFTKFYYYTRRDTSDTQTKSPGVDVLVQQIISRKYQRCHTIYINIKIVTYLFPEPWTKSIKIPLFKKGLHTRIYKL